MDSNTHTPQTVGRFTVASSECSAVWGFTDNASETLAAAYYAEINRVEISTVSIGRKVAS